MFHGTGRRVVSIIFTLSLCLSTMGFVINADNDNRDSGLDIVEIWGTAYSDAGVTPVGAGHNITMAINGNVIGSVVTSGGGIFNFTVDQFPWDSVLLYLNNSIHKGTTFFFSNAIPSFDMDIWGNTLIVRSQVGMVLSDIMAESVWTLNDPDILYTAVGWDISVAPGTDMTIWDGTYFEQWGSLSMSQTLYVTTGATIDINSYDLTADGIIHEGTIKAVGDESVVINGILPQGLMEYYGSGTWGLNFGYEYYDLEFSASGSDWELDDHLRVDNDLIIGTNAKFELNQYDMDVSNSFSNEGILELSGLGSVYLTMDSDSGLVIYDGPGDFILPWGDHHNVEIQSGNWPLVDNTNVNGDLLIDGFGTLDLDGFDLQVAGNFENQGILKLHGSEVLTLATGMDIDSGLVEYYGSGAYTGLTAGNEYYDLLFSGPGSWTLSSDLTINHDFHMSVGTYVQNPVFSFTVANSFSLADGTVFNRYTGTGVGMDPFMVYDCYGLQAMKCFLSSEFVLENDIDCSPCVNWNGGSEFEPVGTVATPFTGNLDGQDFTISNLRITRPAEDQVGMIGVMNGGSAAFVNMANAWVEGDWIVGPLVGVAEVGSVITECSANLSGGGGNTSIGGLVGYNLGLMVDCNVHDGYAIGWDDSGLITGRNDGTVQRCTATGETNFWGYRGNNHHGGIVGYNFGLIDDCRFTGLVWGNGSNTGGLVGTNSIGATVQNSSVEGNVTGLYMVGGLVGWNWGLLQNCGYDSGQVFGMMNVGGAVGENMGGEVHDCYAHVFVNCSDDFAGGLVGNNDGWLNRSYSTGLVIGSSGLGGACGVNPGVVSETCSTCDVTGTGWYIGGLIGWGMSWSVDNCYSWGDVSGGSYVGGLVGNNTGPITNCYSKGVVTGSAYVGGLIGLNTGTATSSYWDIDTSGQATSDGGTPKTTVEMKQEATFVGWDFVTIWHIVEDHTYPFFSSSPPWPYLERPLVAGWNFLSIPVIPSGGVLDSISGKWDYIQMYVAANSTDPWKTYSIYKPPSQNDLSVLSFHIGFWLHTTEACTWFINGPQPGPQNIQLYAGWNLIGYPSLNTETVANALWGTGADRVMVCDTSEPYHIKEVGPTYLMKPGEGYWVHVPFDTTWTIDW